MNKVIFLPIEPNMIVPGRFFVTLENVQKDLRDGHKVNLIYCGGEVNSRCWINTKADKSICRMCNLYKKQYFYFLDKRVNTVKISTFFDTKKSKFNDLEFNYKNNQDIKDITYKDVNIGFAAFSSYISPTRNLYPKITPEFKEYFDNVLKATAFNTDVVIQSLEKFKPDSVGVFNSRFTVSRPAFDVCKKRGIDLMVYETTGNVLNSRQLTYFKNSTPHNIEYNTKLMNEYWDSPGVSQEEKINIAKSYYENRRNAIQAGDKVYTAEQKQGMLPDNWNKDKYNIVILNSSEDEYASLGDEFENNLFKDQYRGINYISNHFKDNKDIHFYLRIHPNLKTVPFAYHCKLHEFDNPKSNFTVIPGDSQISTYAMIDNSDKVIVFGSSTGPESVYMGKVVILLSNCFYSLLDICYTPKSIEELNEMILDKALKPKSKLGAYKAAYYRMNKNRPNFEFFQYEIKPIKVLKKHLDLYFWKTDSFKFRNLLGVTIQLFGKIYRAIKIKRPVIENKNILEN